MPLYNVHLYREMRLYFTDITADTPCEAARLVGERPTNEAAYTEDCDGENLAALIDLAGDDDFTESVMIDFEPERMRKAVPELLEAIQDCIGQIHALLPSHQQSDSTLDNMPTVQKARSAIAKATAAQHEWRQP